ncbi:transglutaminase domain-containing protein [Ureibacillus sp. FSL K6-3587]|uniref:transglutaminase TgpA family protein n=1 Tax=Ureibacillus sp. FSL K6-3587 TaxID=2954681 RepID=UPI00315934FC
MKNEVFNKFELALYGIMIFLILREWLLPIMMLTGMGYVELILLFILLCLLFSLFRIPFFISWVVKICYISWFIVYVYSDFSLFSSEGIQFLFNELYYNVSLILQGSFFYITNAFQSVLFFLLMWMLVYIVHYWLTVRLNIFYFLVLTVIFIGILDTFTNYDGTVAIVEVVLIGLLMLVFLYIKKLMLQSGASFNWHQYFKLALPVLLMIGVVGAVAILLPKAAPQWPDPVPYIKSAANQGGRIFGEPVKKVGYDEDDSALGGSFVGDDTVVFIAQAATKQYWRVETKDFYTSKGWESSGDTILLQQISYGQPINHSLPVGPEGEEQFAHIEPKYPYDFVIQPYGLVSINVSGDMADQVNMAMNLETEKIATDYTGEYMYHIKYSTPEYLYSDLTSTIQQPIDISIREKYLQLPDSLPQRVIDLAREIVKDKGNDYEKARAIESYFATNGFRYETEGVPVPEEDQDYVDQFLFETKYGYCDNFSSAMVVMLRAVGIPARWVKGFAGGEMVSSDGELKTFEITNNDAHSWVEAYIPKVGWVPFEPTIGFSTNRNIEYDFETDAYQDEMLTVDDDTKPENQRDQDETMKQGNGIFAGLLDFIKNLRFLLYYALIGLPVAGIILFFSRKLWMPKWYSRWLKNQNINETNFEKIYMRLLKMLELKGLKRKEGQTLQSFATEADEAFDSPYMSQITAAYENYLYGNKTKIDYIKVKESLENLINRTSG